MALSRQKTPAVRTKGGDLSAKGAYELAPATGQAKVVYVTDIKVGGERARYDEIAPRPLP